MTAGLLLIFRPLLVFQVCSKSELCCREMLRQECAEKCALVLLACRIRCLLQVIHRFDLLLTPRTSLFHPLGDRLQQLKNNAECRCSIAHTFAERDFPGRVAIFQAHNSRIFQQAFHCCDHRLAAAQRFELFPKFKRTLVNC